MVPNLDAAESTKVGVKVDKDNLYAEPLYAGLSYNLKRKTLEYTVHCQIYYR